MHAAAHPSPSALLVAALVAALLATIPLTPARAAEASRLAGATRVDTAVAISQAAFPLSADTVYLARADVFADALAAGALTDGPILLVPSCGEVPTEVAAEIARLEPLEVVALGGESAVCSGLLEAAAAGREVDRLAGPSRIDTAAAIALRAAGGAADVVYLANAADSPDAVAAGSLTDGPVLLTSVDGPVPEVVHDAITQLDPSTVIALGGPVAVPDAVLADAAAGRATERLAGASRVETAIAIAGRAFPATAATAYLARADVFADAIAAGTLTDGPTLLVPSCGEVPPAVTAELARLQPARVVALGGEAAVCQALLDAAAAGAVVGSGDPITDALAAGTLTEVEALRLRVLRLAGDPSVPDEYLVPDPSVDASLVLKQAADQFTTLPPDVQEELAPHLAPPLYTDSAATGFAQDGTSPTGCLGGSATPPPAAEGWDAVVTAHATIHWPTGGDVFGSTQVATPEEVAETAHWVGEVIETIYAAETELFGVHPLPDTEQACSGGDGSLDIYVSRTTSAAGAATYAYPPGCEQRPSWITIAPDYARSPMLVRDALAHELTHVLQFGGYDYVVDCYDYDWLGEATGNWAVDYVYPLDQFEHESSLSFFREGYADHLWAARTYGSGNGYEDWVFLLSLARTVGPDAIALIWDLTVDHGSVEAIDAAFPDGVDDHWHDFALRTLNRIGADDLEVWDALDQRVTPRGPIEVPLGDTPLRPRYQNAVLGLSLDIVSFTFPDDTVRQIDFSGLGFSSGELEHGRVQAWILLRDGSTRVADITESGALTFCRDEPQQDVMEVDLVYSNGLAARSVGNLINFPQQEARVVGSPSCGSALVGTVEISEVIDVDHTLGNVTTTGREETQIVADLSLVPDPEGDGGQWIDSGASTYALSAVEDTTDVHEGQCTAHITSTGDAGGPVPDDGVFLGVEDPSGTDQPVLLSFAVSYTEHVSVESDVPQCDEGDFDVLHTFILGCPLDNGVFGASGVLHTATTPRTVTFDCTDTVEGPNQGDTTTIRVTGTLREGG